MKMQGKRKKHQSSMSNFVNVLEQLQAQRDAQREQLRQKQSQFAQYNQVFIQLQSSYDSKKSIVKRINC